MGPRHTALKLHCGTILPNKGQSREAARPTLVLWAHCPAKMVVRDGQLAAKLAMYLRTGQVERAVQPLAQRILGHVHK